MLRNKGRKSPERREVKEEVKKAVDLLVNLEAKGTWGGPELPEGDVFTAQQLFHIESEIDRYLSRKELLEASDEYLAQKKALVTG